MLCCDCRQCIHPDEKVAGTETDQRPICCGVSPEFREIILENLTGGDRVIFWPTR